MSKPIAIHLRPGDAIEGAPVQNLLTGEIIVSIRRADGTLTEERGPPGSYLVQTTVTQSPDCRLTIGREGDDLENDPNAVEVSMNSTSTTGSKALDAILAKYNKPK